MKKQYWGILNYFTKSGIFHDLNKNALSKEWLVQLLSPNLCYTIIGERIKMFKIKFNNEKQYATVSINRNNIAYKITKFIKSDSDDHLKIKRTLGVPLFMLNGNLW